MIETALRYILINDATKLLAKKAAKGTLTKGQRAGLRK